MSTKGKTYIMWMCDQCDDCIEDGLALKKWKNNHKCPFCKKGKMTKQIIEAK